MRRVFWRVPVLVIAFFLLFMAYLRLGYCLSDKAIWPEASGDVVLTNGSLTVDASHADQGYIMVKAEPMEDKKYKMRIALGKATMTYDVNSDGSYAVYPLQLGSGKYTITLYKQSKGKKYSEAGTVKSSFTLADELAPFLGPNIYVDYTKDSAAVALSDEICAGLTTDQEKYEAVKQYIIDHYAYDYIKSASVGEGVMPDMNHVLNDGMGICQDLSALASCMLRVQGVYTRFIIGYCGKSYHAWCYVHIDGQDILYDPTADLIGDTSSKYTIERYY